MENSDEYKRHVLYFLFRSGENATKATEKLNTVHGENFISIRTAQKWFKKFKEGAVSVEDMPRSGRPIEFDNEVLKNLVDAEPQLNVDEIAERLNSSHGTVYRHLQEIGKVSKLGKWVPHELSEENRQQRINVCTSLLSRQTQCSFLDRIVTGDEKWILYESVTRKRQWVDKDQQAASTSKAGLQQHKMLLCVWWDNAGIIYHEFLEPNKTITAALYIQQLTKLNSELIKKRPTLVNRKQVLFHQDNARPHTAKTTIEKIKEFNWEIMHHPPYSPDIAPSDYHLFRSLQNYLTGKKFNSADELKDAVSNFFASKSNTFYKQGIGMLPERWQLIIDNEGKYIID